MRLIFVRHGDPDYNSDSLTEKGKVEASLLRERIAKLGREAEHIEYYVSPLGRAKLTAELALEGSGIVPVEKDWLQEFCPPIKRPDRNGANSIGWDWLPKDWMTREHFFDKDRWITDPIMQDSTLPQEYARVTGCFEELLNEHGYKREGMYYLAEKPNNDTLVFFCHFGLTCVLAGYLLGISPMVLWHGICAAPTSVTSIVTEERREGIASFRMNMMGDISHLEAAGEPASFSARFCECYANKEERHD